MARRDYQNEYPSVTTILGVLRKIPLEIWFKQNTPEFIEIESEKGKLIGTQIHEAIQGHIEKAEVEIRTDFAEEVTFALKSFALFRREHPEIKLKKSEIVLTSEIYKYNGTMDVEAEISKLIVPGDWKTGKTKKYDKLGNVVSEKDQPDIYDEYIIQVSAYLKAYNEMKKGSAEEAFIAVFAKDKIAYNYRLIPKEEITYCFEEIFLPAIKICYGQKQLVKLRKELRNA